MDAANHKMTELGSIYTFQRGEKNQKEVKKEMCDLPSLVDMGKSESS